MQAYNQDEQARDLALDIRQSFIVQAPAGSGKTELLIQRLLALLSQVTQPEEILSITFTKKAANEMRTRVIKALNLASSSTEPESKQHKKTWQLAKKVLERDAILKWNLLNNPNQLRIQTIDSLCAYLTKQLPLLAHFGAQPDISVYPHALYREAVQELLIHIEKEFAWSNDIAKLLLHFDNDVNRLQDLLINLLAKRDQWLSYIQLHSSDLEIKNHLENNLSTVITLAIKNVRSIFTKQDLTELLAIARFAADHLIKHQPDCEIVACRHLSHLPNDESHSLSVWIGIAKLLLTKTFSWRKRIDADIGFPPLKNIKSQAEKLIHTQFRQRLQTMINKLSTNENLRQALTSLFFLPSAKYKAEQWQILQALLHVLKIAVAQLRVTFQQHGQIDFIENVQAALLALGTEENPTDLALALDYQIQHILIDEFQDTSFVQYQLLEKLTMGWQSNDGRTLFVVGDPMQSIYRFREAEVGLFLQMRAQGLGQIQLKPLQLSFNFRSTKNLIEWNNKHFQTIFPQQSDIATGAVSYSPSETTTHKVNESTVTVKGLINADEGQQAQLIVDLIKQLHAQNSQEKIAILVRSRSHLSALIPEIKKAKIAFQAIDIDPLATRQCIQDLLSLTCALFYPADRIAWLAILRAPWCGLTLNDLYHIANEDAYITIYEQLERNDVRERLSLDGQRRIDRIFPILKNQINERMRYSLRTWIEETWLSLGGPACLNDYAEIEDVYEFFHLLEEFDKSLSFNIDLLKEKITHLFASKFDNNACLQIMTIHAAKGLEFDTVILPHLERKSTSDSKDLLSWMEQPIDKQKMALLIAPLNATGEGKDTIYEYITRQQKIKYNYEIDRLFYVATTRAKKSLYLFFNITQNENQEFKIENGSFLEKLWPLIAKENILLNDSVQIEIETNKTQRELKRLNSHWKNPILKATAPIIIHKKNHGFKIHEGNSIAIGIITHRILQKMSQNGLRWWQEKPFQIDYLHYHLKQLGVLSQHLEESVNVILKAIENTLNDERGRWILMPHHEARAEYALTAVINGEIKNIVIDRTFIDDEGIRWIIDYKTTPLSSQDPQIFLQQEQDKHSKQMALYSDALQLLNDSPIRMGLYFPVLPAWIDW